MEYKLIRSNRRTISIQINQDLSIVVRAPRRVSQREIDNFVKEKEPWINKHLKQIRERNEINEITPIDYLSEKEIKELGDKALEFIPERVRYFAGIIGVSYGRITIRNQKTRWGSCSSKGNLNFNCLLMLTPPEVIDYVIVHELCHRKEMNHSRAFWNEVGRVLPNYKECEKFLKREGVQIMRRNIRN